MNIKHLCLFAAFIFCLSSNAFSQCPVNVSSNDGLITITGLTSDANTKLFDANIQSVWECDPWNGNVCSSEEVVPNLIVGATYFLSVQSANCNEWIAIEVEGGDIQPSCFDGIQNQGETDIDCGGPCEPCVTSECNVAVSSENGVTNVTGLSAATNAKIFDENITSIWECNPWNGNSCTNNEVISGLIAGATYFLSAQSDVCAEWIPFVVSENGGCPDTDGDTICDDEDCDPENAAYPGDPGAPCDDMNPNTENDMIDSDGCGCTGTLIETMECNVMVTIDNGTATITGLTSDANTKLFDANYGVEWECNPWNGNPCAETVTISDLNTGAYFLSAQSANCDFWQTVTIVNDDGGGGGEDNDCSKVLSENTPFECVNFLEDGSVRIDYGGPGEDLVKAWYDNDGEFIGTVDYFVTGNAITIEGTKIIERNRNGNIVKEVEIDPSIFNTCVIDSPVSAYNNNHYIFAGKCPGDGSGGGDEVWLIEVDANGNKVRETLITFVEYSAEDYEVWGNNWYIIEGVIATANASNEDGIEVYIKQYDPGLGLSDFLWDITKYEFNSEFNFVNATPLKSAADGDNRYINLHITQDLCDEKSWNIECIERNLLTDAELEISEDVNHNYYKPYFRRTTESTYFVNDDKFNNFILEDESIFEMVRLSRTTEESTPIFPGEFTISYFDFDGNEITDGTIVLNEAPIAAFRTFEGTYRIITAHGNTLYWYATDCMPFTDDDSQQNFETPIVDSKLVLQNVFPNPTNGEAFLQIESSSNQDVQLTIFDVVGQLKVTKALNLEIGNNSIEINVADLPIGIYNITITDSKNIQQTTRFIRN